MSDHALGRALRTALEQQRQTLGGPMDPRRLESQLDQLVTPDQHPLLPALSFLLRSALFSRLLAQAQQGFGAQATTVATALEEELRTIYSPPVCARLHDVIQGTLGLPPASPALEMTADESVRASPVAKTAAQVPAVVIRRERTSGHQGILLAVLGVLVGILGGFLLVVLGQYNQTRQATNPPSTAAPEAPRQSPASPAEPETPSPPVLPDEDTSKVDGGDPPVGAGQGDANAAISSVQQLYEALNARDYERVRNLVGDAAADQFEPAFFGQFDAVSISDLRQVAVSGSLISLEGQVTLTDREGRTQVEARSFTVETATSPAQITASAFGRVISPR